MTSNNFTPEIVNNTLNRNVVTSMYGLRGSWQPTDKFTLDFDAYRSTANRPEGGTDTFVTAGLVSSQPYAQDIITVTDVPHSLPNLNVAIPPSQLGLTACPTGIGEHHKPGYCSYTALMNSGFLNNNKYWSTHYDGLNGYSVHDQVTGFTLDGALQCGVWDSSTSCCSAWATTIARRTATTSATTGPTAPASTARCTTPRVPGAVQPLFLRLAGLQRHFFHQSAEFHARRRRIVPDRCCRS